jgi:HTH-type transcriptional regulator/antitoxin HigA
MSNQIKNEYRVNVNDVVPAFATHPGELIHDELEARGMSQTEFSKLIDYNKTQLNEVIKGKRNINAELALLLEKALGIDASYWMRLQASYDLDIERIKEKTIQKQKAIETWKMIEHFVPKTFYKKQGLISGDPKKDIEKVYEVFGVHCSDDLAGVFSQPRVAMYRKSNTLTIDETNLIGWDYLVRYNASQINLAEFNAQCQNKLVEGLKSIIQKNKNVIKETQSLLNLYGIKLVLLEKPEKCSVDGVAFWSHGNPAIGLSMRFQRLDWFAFTLFHELGHVFLHLINDNELSFLDIEEKTKTDIKEKEADQFALNHLIPQNAWKQFIDRHFRPNDDDFTALAKQQNIHPAIVLGRYKKEMNKFSIKSSIAKDIA